MKARILVMVALTVVLLVASASGARAEVRLCEGETPTIEFSWLASPTAVAYLFEEQIDGGSWTFVRQDANLTITRTIQESSSRYQTRVFVVDACGVYSVPTLSEEFVRSARPFPVPAVSHVIAGGN